MFILSPSVSSFIYGFSQPGLSFLVFPFWFKTPWKFCMEFETLPLALKFAGGGKGAAQLPLLLALSYLGVIVVYGIFRVLKDYLERDCPYEPLLLNAGCYYCGWVKDPSTLALTVTTSSIVLLFYKTAEPNLESIFGL